MVQGPWRVLTCPTASAVRWWGLRGPGSVRRTGAHCRNCFAADRRCSLPAFAFEGFPLLHVALPGPLLLDRRNPARLPCLLPEILLRPPALQIPICSPSEPESFQNTSHFHPVTQHNGFSEKLCYNPFLLLWRLCCVTGTPPAAVSGPLNFRGALSDPRAGRGQDVQKAGAMHRHGTGAASQTQGGLLSLE